MLGSRAGFWATLVVMLAACGGEEGGGAAPRTPTGTTTALQLPKVDERPPSAKQLLGTWCRTGSSTLFRFNRDGTFDVDTHRLDDPLYATGPYELDGSTLTFTASGPACADDWQWQIGIVRAESRADDELHIVFHEEGCGIPVGAEWTLARL
jgi:hypothetical protein